MRLQGMQLYKGERNSRRAGEKGWALTESMVAVSIGITFLVAVIGIFTNCSVSFAALGNYINMDRKSRNALDRMSMNIRSAKQLTSFSPSALVFNYDSAGTTNLAYRYDSATGLMTEEWTTAGSTTITTLLSGCTSLTFALYDRDLVSASDAASGKVISASWQCVGTVISRTNTEVMNQAQIVIRNQP